MSADHPRPPSWVEDWILLPLINLGERMISDFVLSIIRTYIPVAVGTALTWLATRLDVVLDGSEAAGLQMVAVALVSGAYYLVARWLESRWPFLSILLGTPPKVSTPTYTQLPKE